MAVVKGIFLLTCFIHFCAGKTPQLRFRDSQGRDISSPAYRQQGSKITLECQVSDLDLTTASFVFIQAQIEGQTDQTITLITCVRDSEGQPQFKKGLISNYSTGEVTGSCIGTNSKVTIESLPGNFPTDLTCKVVDTSGDDFYAPMNMLYTYETASMVRMTNQVRMPGEGEMVSYTCASDPARPPVKLEFLLFSESGSSESITTGQQTHYPEISQITDISAKSISNITWTVNVTQELNGKTLQCRTIDDGYRSVLTTTRELSVIYGPLQGMPDVVVSYNISDYDKMTITCNIDANPDLSYEWFLNSADGISVGTGAMTEIIGADHYKVGETVEITYLCRGTNADNSNKSATRKYIVKIFECDCPPPVTAATQRPPDNNTGGITDGDKPLLEVWEIVLIAVGAAIALIILIVVIIVVCRSRDRSPATKKKKAAKQPETKGAVNQKYQASDNSLYGHQADLANNYRNDQMNSPSALNHRYSNYGQNIEDYADTLDDRPRSRKPIAMDELSLDPYDTAPPSISMSMDGGPPAYQPHPAYSSPHDSYNVGYGAPC